MAKPKKAKRPTGPNRFPEAKAQDAGSAPGIVAAATAAAAAVAAQGAGCRFLGHDFAEGEKICYRDEIWVCAMGQWARTGVAC